MEIFLSVFSLMLLSSATDDAPPSSLLRRTSIVDIPSVSKSLIGLPIRCGPSGEIFLRMYRPGDPMGAPVLEVTQDKTSVVNTFDFQKIRDSSIPNPEILKVTDFQVQGSTLYALALGTDSSSYILKFSADDASYEGSFALEKGLFPRRFAVYDSGSLIITGMLTRVDSITNLSKSENVTIQYARDGRLIQYVHLFGDLTFAGSAPTPQELDVLTGSYISAYSTNAYLVRPGTPPRMFVIPEGGGKIDQHALWTPGADWSLFSFLMSGDRALISFVQNLEQEGKTSQYVQYSLSSFEPTSTSYTGQDVMGAFGCTDWRGNYSFITTRNKHLAILVAR
jgi:hypothetical protein